MSKPENTERESTTSVPRAGDRMPTKRWIREQSIPVPSMSQGVVLIVDADVPRRTAYAKAVAEHGFTTESVGTAKDGIEALLKSKFEAFVLDIDLPDTSGLTILSTLMRKKLILPAVVASRQAYQHEFEVKSYPKLKFLGVKDPDLVALAVRQIVPAKKPSSAAVRSELERGQQQEERIRSRELQEMMVVQELPDFPGWDSAALYQPCSAVGGDYLDIFSLADGRVGIVVADVSGHGFPAAMIMVMIRAAFRLLAPMQPARETVLAVNAFITRDIKKKLFASVLYAVLDPETGRVEIYNCGHNPPLLVGAGGSHLLHSSGLAVGLNAGPLFERELKASELTLDIGDALVLYTDGVVEAKNAANEDLSEEALLQVATGAGDGGAQDLVDAIAESIVEHRGSSAQSDDITIVAFKRLAFISAPEVPTLLDQVE